MKDIRIAKPRQIIKHEILCPKVKLEKKEMCQKKMEDRNLEDMERNRKKKIKISIRNRMPQNQSTI